MSQDPPDFNRDDLVMFSNRAQSCATGMRVQEVNKDLFGVRLKVDQKWWVPENFTPFETWKSKFGPNAGKPASAEASRLGYASTAGVH